MIEECTKCGKEFLTEADAYVVKPTNEGVKLLCLDCVPPFSWQKIETAPRDGTFFSAYNKVIEDATFPYSHCYWSESKRRFHDEFNNDATGITHWKPLDEPPEL